ncbi:MAG: tetratricopeptide repeat protein [Flavobacteriales bacterium]
MKFLLAFPCFALAMLTASAQDDLAATYSQGEKAYRNGDHQEAIGYFSKVLGMDSDNLNAYLQRGFCNSILKQYAAAVADFSSVIERKSDHIWAYTSRGSAYAKLGDHQKAMADFDQAIALDPKNEEAYNNRGWSRKALGDFSGACADWKASKKMGNGEARIILENNRCK